MEEEVSEEEESAEKRGTGAADVESFGEAGCGSEAVVGAIDVGEAVGDEDCWQDDEPAFAHLEFCPSGFGARFLRRARGGDFHRAIIIVAVSMTLGNDGAFVVACSRS